MCFGAQLGRSTHSWALEIRMRLHTAGCRPGTLGCRCSPVPARECMVARCLQPAAIYCSAKQRRAGCSARRAAAPGGQLRCAGHPRMPTCTAVMLNVEFGTSEEEQGADWVVKIVSYALRSQLRRGVGRQ